MTTLATKPHKRHRIQLPTPRVTTAESVWPEVGDEVVVCVSRHHIVAAYVATITRRTRTRVTTAAGDTFPVDGLAIRSGSLTLRLLPLSDPIAETYVLDTTARRHRALVKAQHPASAIR